MLVKTVLGQYRIDLAEGLKNYRSADLLAVIRADPIADDFVAAGAVIFAGDFPLKPVPEIFVVTLSEPTFWWQLVQPVTAKALDAARSARNRLRDMGATEAGSKWSVTPGANSRAAVSFSDDGSAASRRLRQCRFSLSLFIGSFSAVL